MLMKERRLNNVQQKQDYIEMRLPASAEYVSLIRLTLSGVLYQKVDLYDLKHLIYIVLYRVGLALLAFQQIILILLNPYNSHFLNLHVYHVIWIQQD